MAKKQTTEKKTDEKKTSRKKTTGSTVKTQAKSGQKSRTRGRRSGSAAKTAADNKAKLVKEITGLLGKMDEVSLNFIRRQANVIVTAGEYEEIRRKTMDALSGLEAGRSAPTAPDAVSIERRDDSFFNIAVRGTPVFFNIEEMRALTRIAHASPDGKEAARRLLAWFRKERNDFLNETGIEGPADPALPRLWETIVTTYKVKA